MDQIELNGPNGVKWTKQTQLRCIGLNRPNCTIYEPKCLDRMD